MFPLFIAWVGWPLLIPIHWNYFVYIATVPIVVFLCWRGHHVVKTNWRSPSDRPQQQLLLVGVYVELPESGGLVFRFIGRKPPEFIISQARLSLLGDILWRQLGVIFGSGKVAAAKLAMHPITLCPNFLQISSLVKGENEFDIYLRLGVKGQSTVIKKSSLVKKLTSIIQQGDPEFYFLMEYGESRFGWKRLGELCRFDTKFSTILKASETGESILAPGLSLPSGEMHVVKVPIPTSPPGNPPESNAVEIRQPEGTP